MRNSGRSDGILDPRVGIVRRCTELAVEADDPRVFCVVSEAADLSRMDPDSPHASRYGCGTGLTREAALAAAVGEVVEGYAASVYAPESIIHASYSELDEEAVPPERFALFTPAQYASFRAGTHPGLPPYAPFTRSTRTGWVHGWSLARRRPVLVPAAFVYLPYRYAVGEPYLTDAFSTGTACARTLEEATLKAVCEVVERDALSIVWQHRLSLPRIVLERDAPLAALLQERLACRGTRWHVLHATLDIPIPTVLAVFVDERGGAAVGTATRPDPREAVGKALMEAAQCRVGWKRDLVRGAPNAPRDFGAVRDFGDHARLYTRRGMRPHLEFLWSSGAAVDPAALPTAAGGGAAAELARCVELLSERGHEPIAFDLTTDDVGEAGYRVVRVVVPGLQPLAARHAAPLLGGSRMRDVPWRLGLRPGPAEEDATNPVPHPFP